MSKTLLGLLSFSIILNGLLGMALLNKAEEKITEKQLMSFCMKNKIPDNNCKIPYQYKRL